MAVTTPNHLKTGRVEPKPYGADDYLRGLQVATCELIPMTPDTKKPRDSGWQINDYTLDDLGEQVAIRLDDNDLIDVDAEWPEAQRLLTDGQYDTWTHGRKGLVTHQLYSGPLKKSVVFKLDEHAPGAPKLTGAHPYTILEVRAGGKYTMIPPSTHPDGDKLELYCDIPPTLNPFTTEEAVQGLIASMGKIAALAALTRFYPAEGSRDDFCFGLAGLALKHDATVESTERMIRRLAEGAGDSEVKMRVAKVKRAQKRLDAGKEVAGFKHLADHCGIPVEWMKQVLVWAGLRDANPEGGQGPVVFDNPELKRMVRQSLAALEEYEVDGNPGVYRFGGALARINGGKVQLLDRATMRSELGEAATFLKKGTDKDGNVKWTRCTPSKDLAEAVLASRVKEFTVAELVQVSRVPIFTPSGRLLNRTGYDPETRIYVDLNVEAEPDDDVRAALRTVWECFADFSFVDRSDRAHLLAMVLEPFVRPMLAGTPLNFISKPSAGSGASLLAECATFIGLGKFPGAKVPPRRDEEMQKVLTAELMAGASCIFFDNVTYLDSSELASALTADTYSGRVLGRSEIVDMPVRCTWIGTGINSQVSGELYRRMVDIRIDPEVANPEDRPASTFRYPLLKKHVRDNRERLVAACLTLVQHWVDQGMPMAKTEKASFPEWGAVMGGIMESLNIRGFAETPKERRQVDPMDAVMFDLLVAMLKAKKASEEMRDGGLGHYGQPDDPVNQTTEWCQPVQAKAVMGLAEATGLAEDMGLDAARQPAKLLGSMLRRYKGRWFEGHSSAGLPVQMALQEDRSVARFARWWVEVRPMGDA